MGRSVYTAITACIILAVTAVVIGAGKCAAARHHQPPANVPGLPPSPSVLPRLSSTKFLPYPVITFPPSPSPSLLSAKFFPIPGFPSFPGFPGIAFPPLPSIPGFPKIAFPPLPSVPGFPVIALPPLPSFPGFPGFAAPPPPR